MTDAVNATCKCANLEMCTDRVQHCKCKVAKYENTRERVQLCKWIAKLQNLEIRVNRVQLLQLELQLSSSEERSLMGGTGRVPRGLCECVRPVSPAVVCCWWLSSASKQPSCISTHWL